jgi:hypothetical protein
VYLNAATPIDTIVYLRHSYLRYTELNDSRCYWGHYSCVDQGPQHRSPSVLHTEPRVSSLSSSRALRGPKKDIKLGGSGEKQQTNRMQQIAKQLYNDNNLSAKHIWFIAMNEIDIDILHDNDPILHLWSLSSAAIRNAGFDREHDDTLPPNVRSYHQQQSKRTISYPSSHSTSNRRYPSRVAASFDQLQRAVWYRRTTNLDLRAIWICVITKWDVFALKMINNGIGAFLRTFPTFQSSNGMQADQLAAKYATSCDPQIIDDMW